LGKLVPSKGYSVFQEHRRSTENTISMLGTAIEDTVPPLFSFEDGRPICITIDDDVGNREHYVKLLEVRGTIHLEQF
jgi:hypothetical protein